MGRALTTLGKTAGLVAALLLAAVSPAAADDWLPHPADAQWQYRWADSVYNPTGTVENVTVQRQAETSFVLAWAAPGTQTPAPEAPAFQCLTIPPADLGTISFQDTNSGLLVTNWNSCPPPQQMPILCAGTSCANSLASALYNVIWGNRVPVISEPLLRGTTWTAAGGAHNDVTSASQYLGRHLVSVPAFPHGVLAAVVRSQIAQAGALGDPYGSGIRTTWWVRGVGPVKLEFQHAGGSPAPVTTADLLSTNLKPLPARPDQDYFPLRLALSGTYKWTNSEHLPQPEVEKISVDAVANRTARISARSVSGPIRLTGQYGFTLRLDGLTNIWASTSAATLANLPPLGHGRHLFTPIDLMTFGFNPLLPAYPSTGASWRGGNGRDFAVFGVTGTTKVIGVRTVRVPAGTFRALEVRSVLTQRGYPFGSGVRTCWFAPGRGLVKLLFEHRDGSVSLVQLLK